MAACSYSSKTPTGKTVTMPFGDHVYAQKLGATLHLVEGFAPSLQCAMFAGKQLEVGRIPSEYNIQTGSTLELKSGLSGVMMGPTSALRPRMGSFGGGGGPTGAVTAQPRPLHPPFALLVPSSARLKVMRAYAWGRYQNVSQYTCECIAVWYLHPAEEPNEHQTHDNAIRFGYNELRVRQESAPVAKLYGLFIEWERSSR